MGNARVNCVSECGRHQFLQTETTVLQHDIARRCVLNDIRWSLANEVRCVFVRYRAAVVARWHDIVVLYDVTTADCDWLSAFVVPCEDPQSRALFHSARSHRRLARLIRHPGEWSDSDIYVVQGNIVIMGVWAALFAAWCIDSSN